jgi:hypothetical protein
LPPVQQGCELYSLDTAGNSETEKQPVEMSFHSSSRHVELVCDFGVVASLQQQLYDLLFARTEPNGLLLHPILPFCQICLTRSGVDYVLSETHCIRVAIFKILASDKAQESFPQGLAGDPAADRGEFNFTPSADGWSNNPGWCRKSASKHTQRALCSVGEPRPSYAIATVHLEKRGCRK